MKLPHKKNIRNDINNKQPNDNADTEYIQLQKTNYDVNLWKKMFYNRVLRGIIIIIAFSIIVPVLLLLFMDISNPNLFENHKCNLNANYNILCGDQDTTYEHCSKLMCCFNFSDNSCFHTFPSYYQYELSKTNDMNNYELKPIMDNTPFNKKNQKVFLNYEELNDQQMSITLSSKKQNSSNKQFLNADYKTTIVTEKEIYLYVIRKENNDTLLSTAYGPTIISEKYWEWTLNLNATYLYGMDFFLADQNETFTRIVYKNSFTQNALPRFIAYKNGKFYGIDIEHTGPLEVTILPSKLIVLRQISGNFIKVTLSTGPKPEDIVRQLRGNIKTSMPPYWFFGVHICRDGQMSFEEIIENFEASISQNFPFDSDCIHEDLFSLSINMNSNITKAIESIRNKGKHFMMSLSPLIHVNEYDIQVYNKAKELNILYTKYDEILNGTYREKIVAYPDYSNDTTKLWFSDIFKKKLSGIKPDGIVLRNTWPLNEDYDVIATDMFPYFPEQLGISLGKTLPWDSKNSEGVEHIEVHNSYATEFTEAVVATINDSPLILTTAQTSNNQYAVHEQNIPTSWSNFNDMIKKTLSHSLFGGPLHSTPVCGTTNEFSYLANYAVCQRWYIAAATMPLFRVSSEEPRRDPANLKENLQLQKLAIEAIRLRYKFLPYIYTTLEDFSVLVKPMFYHFYEDKQTLVLDSQYMIGDALLIANPKLFPVSTMQVYLPTITGKWYEFWTGLRPASGWNTVPIFGNDLIAYVAPGKILPLQNNINTLTGSYPIQPLTLLVTMSNDKKADGKLSGKIYEKSSTVVFNIVDSNLTIKNVEECSSGELVIENIKVYNEKCWLYVLKAKRNLCITDIAKEIVINLNDDNILTKVTCTTH